MNMEISIPQFNPKFRIELISHWGTQSMDNRISPYTGPWREMWELKCQILHWLNNVVTTPELFELSSYLAQYDGWYISAEHKQNITIDSHHYYLCTSVHHVFRMCYGSGQFKFIQTEN